MSRLAYFFVIISGLVLCKQDAFALELTLRGTYQGKNIFVQNPYLNEQQVFCTQSVTVNGRSVLSYVKSSAYEIDLSFLSPNQALEIIITHWENCSPKILNPQVVKPLEKFRFLDFQIDESSLRWKTVGEWKGDTLLVEQKTQYTDWEVVVGMAAKGNQENNMYSISLDHAPGINLFRVKYISDFLGEMTSSEHEFEYKLPPVTFSPARPTTKISLSREAEFEILDRYENFVMGGKAKEINIRNLPPGGYYLVIESQREKFLKR
jgi:hypothetical protein